MTTVSYPQLKNIISRLNFPLFLYNTEYCHLNLRAPKIRHHPTSRQNHEMLNQQELGNKITFPKRSSPVGRGTTKGGAILPEANTSVCAPVMPFIIIYSLLIPRHMLSPHQAIDFTKSGMPNSFTSTNSRPPEK
jgi:hypothetical protein